MKVRFVKSHEYFSFLDFMAKWVADSKPTFMNIAYTTEKSIQDELDRTSKAEVMTMVSSYLLMFVYISIALGRVRSSLVGCFVSFLSTSSSTSRNRHAKLTISVVSLQSCALRRVILDKKRFSSYLESYNLIDIIELL